MDCLSRYLAFRESKQALDMNRQVKALERKALEETRLCEQRIVDRAGHDHLPALALGLKPRGVGAAGDQDNLWHEHFNFEIVPHPELTPSKQSVVAKDYRMTDGKSVLTVRYAMLFYLLRRLGLLGDASKETARRQHIVASSRSYVQTAQARAEFIENNTENAVGVQG
jgi:hypothetical protein